MKALFTTDVRNLFDSSKQTVKKLVAPPDRLQQPLKTDEDESKTALNDNIFRRAFECAPTATAVVARSGEMVLVNRAFCDLVGYTETELSAMTVQELTPPEDLEEFDKMLAGRIQTNQFEQRLRHKQGHLLWTGWLGNNGGAENNDFPFLIFQLQVVQPRKHPGQRFLGDSLHDPLTGLPNRVLLMERLQVAFNRARLYTNKQFAVFFMDFERAGLTAENSGEIADEQLHTDVARRVECAFRPGDFVAKLGGNKFAALLEDIADSEEVVQLAERLCKDFCKQMLFNEQEIDINLYVGISIWSREYTRADFLLRDANSAFYHSKRLGRTHYEVYDSEIHKRARYLLQLEKDLWNAVERGELFLRYQPIINLKTCQLVGFEALVRWQHPAFGLISPNEFISIAEENNSIIPIGKWVLEEACRQLKILQRRCVTSKNLWMSVNVSGKQLIEPELNAEVVRILDETGVSPAAIKLEITESTMIKNTETVINTLNGFKDFGIGLSVDDFGTGYSSLSNLHRLPINTLKIDRSFVSMMPGSDENREITKSIVELAQSLNLEIIAEGVETGEQVVQLQNLGCSLGQGYYFAQPLDVPTVENLLDELERSSSSVKTSDELTTNYF